MERESNSQVMEAVHDDDDVFCTGHGSLCLVRNTEFCRDMLRFGTWLQLFPSTADTHDASPIISF